MTGYPGSTRPAGEGSPEGEVIAEGVAEGLPAVPPVVLVTGATGGIGSAAVRAFAARGARLVLLARSPGALERLAGEVVAGGAPTPVTAAVDVTDADAVEAAVADAVERFGRLDVVVHAAAVVAYGRLTDVPHEVWDRVVTVGILGTANVARASLRTFTATGGGHLVVIGSVLGHVTTPLMGAYVTAKFAVRGLVRVLQQEARATPGIRVAIVEPGAVATPIYTLAANYAGRIGRPPPPVAGPEAVADAVLGVVDRGRRTASVGALNPVMRLGFAFTPWLYDRLVGPLMDLVGLERTATGPHRGNVFEPSEQVVERVDA